MSDTTLGERLKAARLATGLTMAELATICGLTKGFISQVESGASDPSLNTLRKIGSALKVSVSDLLDGADALYRAEHIATETFRPRVLSEATGQSGRPGIVRLSSGPEGIHSLATVPAGSRLVYRGKIGGDERHRTAVVTVLSGRVRLLQAQEELELARGGVASWDAGADYTIEATGLAEASLVLFTPQGCSLPVYQVARGSVEQTRTPHRVSPVPVEPGVVRDRTRGLPSGTRGNVPGIGRTARGEGPLRLVAMRAQRLAARRGQS